MKKVLLALLASILALALVGGCASDEAEEPADTPVATEETAETEADTEGEGEAEAASGGTTEFAGSWENPDGSVFREITFHDDGTAETVNYAGTADTATWTFEDDYLKVETDGGESWGSSVEWISDSEFKWSYESDTWTKAE